MVSRDGEWLYQYLLLDIALSLWYNIVKDREPLTERTRKMARSLYKVRVIDTHGAEYNYSMVAASVLEVVDRLVHSTKYAVGYIAPWHSFVEVTDRNNRLVSMFSLL